MTLRGLLAFDEKKRFMLALIAPAVLVLVFFQILPIMTGTNCQLPRLAPARSPRRPGSA
jgi:hypothetical protein